MIYLETSIDNTELKGYLFSYSLETKINWKKKIYIITEYKIESIISNYCSFIIRLEDYDNEIEEIIPEIRYPGNWKEIAEPGSIPKELIKDINKISDKIKALKSRYKI
jgi:KaiC/GvpD/RAD55 family RecA-like ATPase